jgi:hypothetical protein
MSQEGEDEEKLSCPCNIQKAESLMACNIPQAKKGFEQTLELCEWQKRFMIYAHDG